MIDLRKGALIGLLTFVTIGCSDPEPQVIDVDEAAANAGLASDEYETHENGAIEVKAPEDNSTVENKVLWYQDDLSESINMKITLIKLLL